MLLFKRILIALFVLFCLVLIVTGCLSSSNLPPPQAPSPSPASSPSPPPSSSPPLPAPIREVPQSSEEFARRYSWDYRRNEWTLELLVPRALYDYYKEMPRPPTKDYSVFVTHPLDDSYVGYLAAEIEKYAQREGFDEVAAIEFVTAFVQGLPYTTDLLTTPYDEYPRYPIETLVDNGGDCEDTSILLAALLNSLGYEVVLIAFPDKHCGVGVSVDEDVTGAYFDHAGEKYFYLETTSTGWGIGQIPDDLKGLTAYIYDMMPTPIITHDWNGSIRGNVAELKIVIENLGSEAADDVYVVVGFDAGEGKLWNSEQSEIFDLPVDQSITITLTLKAPLEKHTRLVTQIIDDGYAIDESYSDWFDT